MKKIYRTVAMLSTAAFLFSACGEDGAKDDGGVTKPQIKVALDDPEVSAAGGYTRAVVTIESSDEDATNTVISWGEQKDTIDVSVTEYEIADLTDGDYTIGVVSANLETLEISESVSATATVYGETYAGEIATPTFTMETTAEGVKITWDVVAENCVGKVVEYNNGTEDIKMDIAADEEVTLLPDAVVGETFTYYSLHQPEGCLDEIQSASSEDEFEAIVLPAATFEKTEAGLGRAIIYWSVKAEAGITASVISWGDKSETVEITDPAAMSFEVTDLAEGNVAFEITNIGANDAKSSSVKKTVAVYGDTYKASLVERPYKLTQDKDSQDMIFTWGEVPADYVGTTVIYGAENTEAEVDPLTEELTIVGLKTGDEMTIVTTFRPENGLDDVEIKSTVVCPAYALPEPTAVSAVAGNERAIVTFDVPENADIESYVVKYGDTTAEAVELPADSLALDRGFTWECEVAAVEAGDYTFEVALSGKADPSEFTQAESVAVYDNTTYADQFAARGVEFSTLSGTDATITLFTAEGCGATTLTLGEESVVVEAEATQGVIPNAAAFGKYTISTEYLPFDGALDMVSSSATGVVPGEFLAKDAMSYFYLPGDTRSLDYSKYATGDGIDPDWGPQLMIGGQSRSEYKAIFHSDPESNGEALTFDLGAEYNLSNFKLWPRGGNNGSVGSAFVMMRNDVKHFKIYGTNNITVAMQSAEVTMPSFEGWTQLYADESSRSFDKTTGMYNSYTLSGTMENGSATDEERAYGATNGYMFEVSQELGAFRYIRIELIDNWSDSGYYNFTEIDLFGTYSAAGNAPEEVVDPLCTLPTPVDVTAVGGLNRAQVTVDVPTPDGVTISSVSVNYNGTEVATKAIATSDYGTTVTVDVPESAALPVGESNLIVKFKDGENYSEDAYTKATVYAADGLTAPKASLSYKGGSSFDITFDTSSIFDAAIKFTYGDGTVVDVVDGTLAITDATAGGAYSYETTAYPYEGALDKVTATSSSTFPAFAYKVPSDNFVSPFLAGDAKWYASRTVAKLWDGVYDGDNNTFHNAQYSYGGAITFDLGKEYDLESFKIFQRNDRAWIKNNIRVFRIYGSKENPEENAALTATKVYSAADYLAEMGVTLQGGLTEVTLPDFSAWTPLYTPQEDKGVTVQATNETGLSNVAIIPDPSTGKSGATTDAMKAEALLGHEFAIPEGAGDGIRYVRIQLLGVWQYDPATFDAWCQFAEVEFFVGSPIE